MLARERDQSQKLHDSDGEDSSINILNEPRMPSYFHEVYKEEFINFVLKRRVDEDTWSAKNVKQRDKYYAVYIYQLQHQKKIYEMDKIVEKERERAEKERERAEKERERERAEKAEKTLMELQLERAEKESKEMNTTNKLLEGNQEDRSKEQTDDKTNKNEDPSNKTTNKMTDNKQEEEAKVPEKTKSKGFGVYTCIKFYIIDEQENLFKNIESATKDLQRILIDIVLKTKELFELNSKLSAYNLNKDYDKSARYLIDAFNIPNELSNEWARLTEICETNDKACRALYLEFQKALTLIIDYSKTMIDNYNRDLQVQKEELEKKLEAIQNISIGQKDLPAKGSEIKKALNIRLSNF